MRASVPAADDLPAGRPSRVKAQGAADAGWPVRLNGYVNGRRSNIVGRGPPVDLVYTLAEPRLDGPGCHWHLRRQQQIVADEKRAHGVTAL